MTEITLKFPSILDLTDFESEVKHHVFFINRSHLTMVGTFDEAEIELATKAYHAEVIDNETDKLSLLSKD